MGVLSLASVMIPRTARVPCCVALVVLLAAGPALGFEKTPVRYEASHSGEWSAAATCTIAYYNICTGWMWAWSRWGPRDIVGVCFDVCGTNASCELQSQRFYATEGVCAGYYFIGSMNVYAADENSCPTGLPLATHTPLYPTTGWNFLDWAGTEVPARFVVAYEQVGPCVGSMLEFASDHPAAGPTGPQACGLCYPTNRVVHSFYYGTLTSPLCPGSPYSDRVCDVEWLWEVQLTCPSDVAPTTWGLLKSLYR
jgi:hypothetical protein